MLDRRSFLKLAGTGYLTSLGPAKASAVLDSTQIFAAAFKAKDGSYGLALVNELGILLDTVSLPARGHDVVFSPDNRTLVALARRPGNFALVADRTQRKAPIVFHTPQNRHFYGHGIFSPDGKLFYATENDYNNAQGVIGVYDATDSYNRLGEFPSYGTGPHELIATHDGKMLCVANGGIETHPEFGRKKLNLHNMEPSITLIDAVHGNLVEKHLLPKQFHKLSMRHLDIDHKNRIWFGCQYQGAGDDNVPLLGNLSPGDELSLVDLPGQHTQKLRQYVGSVSCNREQNSLAITSPRGGIALVINIKDKKILHSVTQSDICGTAPLGPGFLFSSAGGKIGRTDHQFYWDNHIGFGAQNG